jgi:polyhydroxyalkanoate synthesis regulator phasin
MDNNNNLLNQILMLGIGTTSLMAEKLQEVSQEWVKDGKLNPDQARHFVEDMTQQFNADPSTWDAQMQRQLKNMMQDLGIARQSEVDELRGRIDRLERQLRDLENRLWR